jgi:carbon storage regulator
MLMLSRKTGQSIVIQMGGTKVEVVVMKQLNGSVSLGVAAPREVQVDRKEIAIRKQAQLDQQSPPAVVEDKPVYHRKREATPPTALGQAFNKAISLSPTEQVALGNKVAEELAAQLAEGRMRSAESDPA